MMKAYKRALFYIARAITSAMIILVYLVPFYWMALTALKSQGETLRFPPTFWVSPPRWDNFAVAFTTIPFLRYLGNSIIVTVFIILGQCFTVIPAAYAFARLAFKGRQLLFGMTLATVMIPAQLVFLPVFLLMSRLGLINSHASLVLPSAASAFGIFMLRQTFRQVPEEVLEAARLDKAGEVRIMMEIMLPIARPTLVTLALLTFISTWNDYFWPLVLTTSDAVRTLPLGIASLRMVGSGITYHTVMAGNLLLILPIAAVFIVARRQIIKAFTYMGEK